MCSGCPNTWGTCSFHWFQWHFGNKAVMKAGQQSLIPIKQIKSKTAQSSISVAAKQRKSSITFFPDHCMHHLCYILPMFCCQVYVFLGVNWSEAGFTSMASSSSIKPVWFTYKYYFYELSNYCLMWQSILRLILELCLIYSGLEWTDAIEVHMCQGEVVILDLFCAKK